MPAFIYLNPGNKCIIIFLPLNVGLVTKYVGINATLEAFWLSCTKNNENDLRRKYDQCLHARCNKTQLNPTNYSKVSPQKSKQTWHKTKFLKACNIT